MRTVWNGSCFARGAIPVAKHPVQVRASAVISAPAHRQTPRSARSSRTETVGIRARSVSCPTSAPATAYDTISARKRSVSRFSGDGVDQPR